jgi:hypothetical protein
MHTHGDKRLPHGELRQIRRAASFVSAAPDGMRRIETLSPMRPHHADASRIASPVATGCRFSPSDNRHNRQNYPPDFARSAKNAARRTPANNAARDRAARKVSLSRATA